MATPRSLPLLLILLATAFLLAFASLSAAAAKDEDLDYIIDNAGDLEANDPEGWLQEGSPDSSSSDSDSESEDLFNLDDEQGQAGEIDETHVHLLAAANFSSFLAARRHVLVEFYAPWCGHCQALAPHYAAAASHLAERDLDVALAKVDATEDAELAEQYSVQGFPTLIFFIDGVHKEYPGERTKDAIVAWITKKLGPGVENLTTVDQAEKVVTGDDTAVLAYLESLSMMFDLTAKEFIGQDTDKSRKYKNFDSFVQAMIAFPLYFPGTIFYKCIQGRKNMQKVLKALLKERLGTVPKKRHGDLLDHVVDELESGSGIIDKNLAVDIVSVLLFGSFAPLAPSLTMAMKFLTDNPNVVEALKEEHEAILKKREDVSSGVTWEEYKSMTFTNQVTNEIARIANVGPAIFRKTNTDVQVKGYTIPAGWLVMISPISVHLNPELFEDPLTFNPWRWQDEGKRSAMLRNFISFGSGLRLCVGAEFSRIQIALFLHTLVTKWNVIKGGDVQRITEIVFPQGCHIQIIPREG